MISLYGLYVTDPTIFDNFQLPEEVNKEELITNLLLEVGELETIYPDSDVMKLSIGAWSRGMIRGWDMIATVLYEKYDPFVNIKRDEVRTITQTRNLQNTGRSTNSVNAWNSTDPATRDINEGIGTDTGTVSTTEHFHVEGDSAITDAQDVAKKEVELRVTCNLYKIITQDFKKRFCLMVY